MRPQRASRFASTGQILRSLEEIRESLAQRVEELSLAVDRLRSQAGLLERRAGEASYLRVSPAAAGDDPIMPSSRPRSSSTPASPPQAGPQEPAGDTQLALDTSTPGASTRPPRAGSISTPDPDQPLSNEEIHLLLDRASQPPVAPSSTVPGRFEDTLERLRTTRRRIREMQTRTSALGDIMDDDIAPRLDPLSADIGDLPWDWTDPLERALLPEDPPSDRPRRQRRPSNQATPSGRRALPTNGYNVYDNADEALAAANDYLTSMRSDPLRVPTRRELDRMGAGMDAIEPEIIESLIRERFISAPGPAGTRARSRGCRPTNVSRLRQAPSPEVVRSTPPSPASTITPDMSITALPIPTVSSSGAAPRAATTTPSTRRLEAIQANIRDNNLLRRTQAESGGAARPMTFGNSSLALPAPAGPRTRRRRGADEALTYRGMDVNARLNDPEAPRSTGELEDSMVTEFLVSVFSRLREDDVLGAVLPDDSAVEREIPQPMPPFAPRMANARIPAPASRRTAGSDLVAAEERLAAARRRLVLLEAQAEQEEADRRERRGVLGVEDVLRGLGESDEGGAGAIGNTRHRERSAALTANGEGNGPRNERPEEVDSVVHIRQFQDGRDERRRVRDRLQHLADVRRAADEVFHARRNVAPPVRGGRPGHDLADWANEAGEDETIFDATRRALAAGGRGGGSARAHTRPAPTGVPAGIDGVYVTVAVSTDTPGATGEDAADQEIVESMRRQFETLSRGVEDPMSSDMGGVWHMEVIGPNGQVLEARSEGPSVGSIRGAGGAEPEGMEGSMERLAWAIVQSADGTGASGVLEGEGEARNGGESAMGGSAMSREVTGSSNRAVEGEEIEDEHRGSTGVRSDLKESSLLEAQAWPVPPRTARRARPYISMLDL